MSDCLNGIGLLVVGVWVPGAALMQLGGITALFEAPELLSGSPVGADPSQGGGGGGFLVACLESHKNGAASENDTPTGN